MLCDEGGAAAGDDVGSNNAWLSVQLNVFAGLRAPIHCSPQCCRRRGIKQLSAKMRDCATSVNDDTANEHCYEATPWWSSRSSNVLRSTTATETCVEWHCCDDDTAAAAAGLAQGGDQQ